MWKMKDNGRRKDRDFWKMVKEKRNGVP